MFGDDQRPWFGKVEHLPGDVVGRHRRGQRRAARRAGLRVVVDGSVRSFGPPQGLARMAGLPARLLAGRLPQVADPWRLLQPIAGRGLAAVAAVQPKAALQLGDPLSQPRHLRCMARLLRQHQLDQLTFRELVEGGAIHRSLESTTRRRVKQNLDRYRRTRSPILPRPVLTGTPLAVIYLGSNDLQRPGPRQRWMTAYGNMVK